MPKDPKAKAKSKSGKSHVIRKPKEVAKAKAKSGAKRPPPPSAEHTPQPKRRSK